MISLLTQMHNLWYADSASGQHTEPLRVTHTEVKNVEKCKRSRWMEAIVYPGIEEDEALRRLEEKGIDYAAITHDIDVVPETGEQKAAHTHVLMRFKDAKTASAVGKLLGVKPERVEYKDNSKAAMCYLLHETDAARKAGKARYAAERLRGSMADEVRQAVDAARGQADEGRQVLDVLDWIESQQTMVKLSDMARWAAANGRWATMRRAGIIFRGILDEHNYAIALRDEEQRRAEKEEKA